MSEYRDQQFVDVRLYFLPRDEEQWRPTKKGVTISPAKLPQLVAALQSAEGAARKAGLIEDAPTAQASSVDAGDPAQCLAVG